MAYDFKLGVSGSESNLPTCVVDELPCDSPDAVVSAEMLDGSIRSNFKTYVPRIWTLEWDWLSSTECDGLDTISALRVPLNYINGYQGLSAGVTVRVKKPFQRTLIVSTSGLTTIRYRGSMVLEEEV